MPHVGLDIREIAHDYQLQVKKYIVEDLKLLNSYDTWHGQCHVRLLLLYIISYQGQRMS